MKKTNWKKLSDEFVNTHAQGKILDVGAGLYHHKNATTLDIRDDADVDIVADITNEIPVPEASFDTVVLNNVLEHIHDPVTAISECGRVVRPGGKIVAVVPFMIKIHQEPVDFHRYTIFQLQNLFKDFEADIRPLGSFTDILRGIISDFAGIVGRREPFQWIIAQTIKILSKGLKDRDYPDYPHGYTIIAKKPQSSQ